MPAPFFRQLQHGVSALPSVLRKGIAAFAADRQSDRGPVYCSRARRWESRTRSEARAEIRAQAAR
jgi:hypothetical protein